MYRYVGDTDNFVEDALFDIGNALGVDPNNPNGKLVIALARIEDLVEQAKDELSQQLEDCCNTLRNQLASQQFGSTGSGDLTINEPSDSLGFDYNQDLL